MKPLKKHLLNGMCDYTNRLLNDSSIDLHVDYDGFSALVFEGARTTIYFTFVVDFENKTFILGVQYFNEWLEILFKEDKNFKSLTVALSEVISIIQTLHKLRA